MMNYETVYDENGQIIERVAYDLEADTVTISVPGKPDVVLPIPDTDRASLVLQDRERKQLERLQTNFQELRQTPPALDNAQLRDEVRLLRSMVLDLTRIVRGMAAE